MAMAVAVGALALGACSASPSGSEPAPLSARAVAAGADHTCVVPSGRSPRVDWAGLRDPVLRLDRAGAKDQALVWADGRWHLLFSEVRDGPAASGAVHWGIAVATSPDLVHWSRPRPWPAQPGGAASPDVARAPDGSFVATYDSPPEEQGPAQAKLYYRTSPDLVRWSSPHPLARSLGPAPADRMIDAALAWTGHGLILGYKAGTTDTPQAFEVAWSPSGSLRGPWRALGRPDITVDGGTVENYEFLIVGGHWDLVATSNNLDQPWIFSLAGDPSAPTSWLRWRSGRELIVPGEPWDTGPGLSSVGFEHANSAFLCVTRGPRPYLLTYAGSSELSQFGGWGHAAVGVAWSTDLVHWRVPPPRHRS
jgi:hypothetical protein